MPILYKYSQKHIPRYQAGNKSPYIYESAEALATNPAFSSIALRAKKTGTTRCLGSALDAGKVCGYDYRPVLGKAFKTAPRVLGDNDNVVDAWDMKNASGNTDDIDIIYDREKDGPISEEMLNNLPLHAFIGTGDARGKYVSSDNKRRISRHGIINLGFTTAGKAIIYDLGKFSEGIPKKYLNESKDRINYIAVPAGEHVYFNKPEVKEIKTTTKEADVQKDAATGTDEITFNTVKPSSYARDFISLINRTFNIN